MTQSKTNRSTPRKSPPRAGTGAKRTASKTPAKDATPLFNGSHVSGFIVGLISGVIASFGVVGGLTPDSAVESVTTLIEGPIAEFEAPGFTFYDSLPEDQFEVAPQSDQPSVTPSIFVLQAGSFRAYADADRRRGELALQGLESSVEASETDTGLWHRVYIGPFDSRSEMARARSLTAQADIDTLQLKRQP